jgi:hypothetical protein
MILVIGGRSKIGSALIDSYASRVTDAVERITGRPASSLDRLLSQSTM